MGSRIRENPTHVFECFCEVVIPQSNEKDAWILQKYPQDFSNEEMLKSVPQFSYPCDFKNDAVQHFSFVLTSLDSKWTFGYCRHAPKNPTVLVLLSYLPWHETFYKLLNHTAELTNDIESDVLNKFLEALYNTEVPEPGFQLHVAYSQGQKEFIVNCPDHFKLPSIPENRNLTEYFNAIDAHNMMVVFASILHERRIMITSRKLSRLSACVQASNSLIYPMQWQHIYIPVLPKHLLDYLSAPMPFLIGVPSITMMQVRHSELGEVVILDADNNRVRSPFNDLEMLPPEIVSTLKRNLKNPNMMLGDNIARAFMRALVHLIGGYRDALKVVPGENISFKSDAFIQSRPSSIQPFLEKMLHLQIFQQFIEGRLDMLNSGSGFSDEFEFEVNLYEDKNSGRLKYQYKEWVTTMRKEGGAFLKNVKNKVRDRGKKAYKDLKSRVHDMQLQKHHSQSDLTYHQNGEQPKSAPSSPTSYRGHPFTTLPPEKKRITSFYVGNDNKHATLEGRNLPNSLSTTRIRRYKMLTVDEVSIASEDSFSDAENSSDMQRIDMDLMGDLQDLIFRKCSFSSDDINASGSVPKESHWVSNTSASTSATFSDSFSDIFLPAPVPPPRVKRKPQQNSSLLKQKSSSKYQEQLHVSDKLSEEPLIHLESLDDIALFDPLQKNNVKDTELLSLISKQLPVDPKVSELKSTLESLTAVPAHLAFQPSPYHSNPSYFTPRLAQPGMLLPRGSVHNSYQMRNLPEGFSSHQNIQVPGRQLYSQVVSTGIGSQAIPPPLPPKTKGSSTSTFFVNSDNYLSKNDLDLLEDYGLSSSPIFKHNSKGQEIDGTSNSANSAKAPHERPNSFKFPSDPFEAQSSHVQGSSCNNEKVQSSWQKF